MNRVSFFIYLARTDHCALVAVDREEAMHLWQNDSTSLQLTPEIEQTPIQFPGNDSRDRPLSGFDPLKFP